MARSFTALVALLATLGSITAAPMPDSNAPAPVDAPKGPIVAAIHHNIQRRADSTLTGRAATASTEVDEYGDDDDEEEEYDDEYESYDPADDESDVDEAEEPDEADADAAEDDGAKADEATTLAAIESDPAVQEVYRKYPNLPDFMHNVGKLALPESEQEGYVPPRYTYLAGPDKANYLDVGQNCWLDATMMSLALINEDWILNRIKTRDNDMAVMQAEVRLTPTGEYQAHKTYWVKLWDLEEKRMEGIQYSTANQYWWPAAIEHAVWAYGNDTGFPGVLNDGGLPGNALTLLAGYTSWNYFPNPKAAEPYRQDPKFTMDPNNDRKPADKVYELSLKSSTTPVLLATYNGDLSGVAEADRKLVPAHVYTICGAATLANGVKMMAVRNPWGTGAWYELEAILPEIELIAHLPASQNGPNQ